jgi:hypothetical protein
MRPNSDLSALEGVSVEVALKYAGKPINKPHLFLNEARLSAIALSIYLGLIKRHVELESAIQTVENLKNELSA